MIKQSLERCLQIQAVALLNFYINSKLPLVFCEDDLPKKEDLIPYGRGIRLWYVTITNEGAFAPLMDPSNPHRSKFMGMAKNHKKMGKMAGQPDIWIGSAFRSIFVEFKSPTGKLSKAQKEISFKIKWAGIPHVVVKDLNSFIKIIELHFGIVLGSI